MNIYGGGKMALAKNGRIRGGRRSDGAMVEKGGDKVMPMMLMATT